MNNPQTRSFHSSNYAMVCPSGGRSFTVFGTRVISEVVPFLFIVIEINNFAKAQRRRRLFLLAYRRSRRSPIRLESQQNGFRQGHSGPGAFFCTRCSSSILPSRIPAADAVRNASTSTGLFMYLVDRIANVPGTNST